MIAYEKEGREKGKTAEEFITPRLSSVQRRHSKSSRMFALESKGWLDGTKKINLLFQCKVDSIREATIS